MPHETATIIAGWAVVLVTMTILLASLDRPVRATALYVALLPVSFTSLLNAPLVGIPGLRPFNLMAFMLLLIGLYNLRRARALPRFAMWFFLGLGLLYAVSLLRSLHHIDLLSDFFSHRLGEDYSTGRYLIFNASKPIQLTLPCFMTALYTRDKNDLWTITDGVMAGYAIFTLLMLGGTFSSLGGGTELSWESARQFQETLFGSHPNVLAGLLLSGFPLLLARLMAGRARTTTLAIIAMVVLVFGLLHSRTGYLALIVSIVIFLILARRGKMLAPAGIFVGLLFMALSLLVPNVMNRFFLGLDPGGGATAINLDFLFSGRITTIWEPLLTDFGNSWSTIFFGRGLYAVALSNASGLSEGIATAHSMYIDIVLESGLAGLTVAVGCYWLYGYTVFRAMGCEQDETDRFFLVAVVASLASYFLRGFMEGSFFPEVSNAMHWVTLGLGVALVRAQGEYNAIPDDQPAPVTGAP